MMVPVIKIGDYFDTIDQAVEASASVPLPQRWHLLRVHPNREAKVVETFVRRCISFYRPMIPRTQVITRRFAGFLSERSSTVIVPLFPGMIIMPDFECIEDRWRDVDYVIGLLAVGPCRATLSAKEYGDVRAIEAIGGVPRSKRERMFKTGQLVQVVDGPFASFAGRIERLDSRGRLSVLLDIFGRMTPLALDEGQIVPARHPTDGRTERQQRRSLPRRP